jgi:hypothetical protein
MLTVTLEKFKTGQRVKEKQLKLRQKEIFNKKVSSIGRAYKIYMLKRKGNGPDFDEE